MNLCRILSCLFVSREALFGGNDIDYRNTDVVSQEKMTSLDADRIFQLNNICFSLAEEKYKSKELTTEEYQATLKLLQTILENEAQRLTVPTTYVISSTILHRTVIGHRQIFDRIF
jgi:hypothetical protein